MPPWTKTQTLSDRVQKLKLRLFLSPPSETEEEPKEDAQRNVLSSTNNENTICCICQVKTPPTTKQTTWLLYNTHKVNVNASEDAGEQ